MTTAYAGLKHINTMNTFDVNVSDRYYFIPEWTFFRTPWFKNSEKLQGATNFTRVTNGALKGSSPVQFHGPVGIKLQVELFNGFRSQCQSRD